MKRLTLLLVGALIATGALCEIGAQTNRGGNPPSAVETKLRDARRLQQEGKSAEIIPQLEEMLRDRPGDLRIIYVLCPAYISVGNYERAAEIYQAEVTRSGGRDLELWIRLADVQRQARLGEELINTLLSALKKKPAWLTNLSDLVEIAVTDTTIGEAALEQLRKRTREPEAPPVWREVLAHASLMTGDFTEAISTLMVLERERKSSGNLLLHQGKVLASRGYSEVALAVFDSVMVISKANAIREQALYEKAQVYERLAQFEQAAETYRNQVQQYPKGLFAVRADFKRANLLKSALDDLPGSREVYESILTRTSPTKKNQRYLKALGDIREATQLALGECALYSQDFDDAESTYVSIEREAKADKTREQAAFERAETLFYQGRFADAEESFYLLTDHYPNGEWVNNALDRVLLIGEYVSQAPHSLKDYARVQLFNRIGAPDSALAICQSALADTMRTFMGDYLAAELVHLYGEAGNWNDADTLVTWLVERYPASRLVPSCLLWMAEQAEADPMRYEKSAEFYEETITRYPASLAARRARVRLRAMLAKDKNS